MIFASGHELNGAYDALAGMLAVALLVVTGVLALLARLFGRRAMGVVLMLVGGAAFWGLASKDAGALVLLPLGIFVVGLWVLIRGQAKAVAAAASPDDANAALAGAPPDPTPKTPDGAPPST